MTENPSSELPHSDDDASGAKCPQCQSPLAEDAPAGLCAACLLSLGFESAIESNSDTDVYRAPFIAPTPEHLAPLFPQLEILERIGHGGMGVVYRARQKQLDRMVALKILRSDLENDPSFAERFQREARLLAQLQHPNIVMIYDFGQSGKLFYLMMEYVEGANLRRIEQSGELTPQSALQIVPQICRALEFAHQRGVVHRDIKPENILVNTQGQVKIADFGLAKMGGRVEDSSLTVAGQVMGTPHYMAPEQIERPTAVDHRADIYSLGVVFYEMLTGELPLGRFAAPSARARVDVRLDQVVLRALEKQPELRYQRVTEVETDLEALRRNDAPSEVASLAAARDCTPLRGDWSGHLYGTNGLLLASDCIYWCGLVDLVLGAVLLLMGLDDDDFLPLGLSGLAAGSLGLFTARLLRYREHWYLALGCSLLLAVPIPCVVFRGLFVAWALCSIRLGKLSFRSPRIGESCSLSPFQAAWRHLHKRWASTPILAGRASLFPAAWRRLQQMLVTVRDGLQDKLPAVWACWVHLPWRRLTVLVSPLAWLCVWTLLCGLAWAAVYAGWVSTLAPVRVRLEDNSASRLENPFGLEHFGIVGRGSYEQAVPALGHPAPFETLEISVAAGRRSDAHTLHYFPHTHELSSTWQGFGHREPLTRAAVEQWLEHRLSMHHADAASVATPEAQAGIEAMLHLFTQTQLETIWDAPASRQWNATRDRHDLPSIAAMLQGSVLQSRLDGGQSYVVNRSVRTDESHVAELLAAGMCLIPWASVVLALLVHTIALMRRPEAPPAERRRSLSIGIALALAGSCAAIALLGYLSQEWLQTHDSFFDVDLRPYEWFRRPESTQQMAASLMGLVAVTCILLLMAARIQLASGHSRRMFWLPVGGLTAALALVVVSATVFHLAHFPWIYHWPLLVPGWLALAFAPWHQRV